MLRNAKLIETDDNEDEAIVSLGKKITLKDLETTEVFEYQLVGSAEANPAEAKISNESPGGPGYFRQNARHRCGSGGTRRYPALRDHESCQIKQGGVLS